MNELKKLVSMVKIQSVNNLEFLTLESQKGKMLELYKSVRAGDYQTDEEAMVGIYGNNKQDAAYRKLKSRLQTQLLNTILFSNSNRANSDKRNLQIETSYRLFSVFIILLSQSAFSSAYVMGKRILKLAFSLEASELIYMVSHRMRRIVERMGDKKKFDYYNEMVHKYQKLHHAEVLAAEYNQNITIHFRKTRSAKTKLAATAKEYSKELKKYTDELDSPMLYLHAYNIYILSHEIAGDFHGLREACHDVATYFDERKPRRPLLVFFFLFKSLGVYVKGKEFEAGEKTIQKAIANIGNLKSRNYFITKEQHVLLAFYCGKYQTAYDQYYQTIKKAGFKSIVEVYRERWKVYEAYLEFLLLNEQLVIHSNKKKSKFRLGRFLNEVPVYSKDKMGLNVSILIVQLLFLLQTKKYADLIDRVDRLKVYAYRYLKKKETMRSYCFVKMLLEIPKAQFHREAVVRKVDNHFSKLKNISPFESLDAGVIEIVCYEDLWGMVLDSLQAKHHKVKSNKN